jgi:hypothetical protein
MTINEKVVSALSGLGYEIEFGIYKGSNDKYITFNFIDDRAELFADDAPIENTVDLQIHFFAPKNYNHMNDKKTIRNSLYNAGFSYPTIQTFYENDTELFHLVFECSIDENAELI